MFKMSGHTDSVTGFRLSPDGSFVLSNAMDNTGMNEWFSKCSQLCCICVQPVQLEFNLLGHSEGQA